MKDCECPYCGSEIEICHDDGYGYEEGKTYQQNCDMCGKTFVYTTAISFDYDTKKADCLNDGGAHEWRLTRTFPKCATRMVCSMCDETRNLTEEERIKHGIPTFKEYFDSLNQAKEPRHE